MTDKKMVDRANEELRKLRKQLANSPDEIGDLQIDDTLDKANTVRERLIALRQRLVYERYARRKNKKQVKNLKTQIHKTLVAITEAVPANKRKLSRELECPITLRALNPDEAIALSNGCFYDRDTIAGYARGQSEFPSKLPGSNMTLSEKDAKDAAKAAARRGTILGSFLGACLGALLWYAIPYALTEIWGINLSGMLAGSLLAAGLTAAATASIVFGVFAAALIVSMIATAVVGAIAGGMAYYRKNKPVELGATIATQKVSTTGHAQQVLAEVEGERERIARKPRVRSGLVEEEDIIPKPHVGSSLVDEVEDDQLDEEEPSIALASGKNSQSQPALHGENDKKPSKEVVPSSSVAVGFGRGQGHA